MRRFQIAALAVTMTIATPIATWAQPVQGDYAGALEVVASYKAALEKLDITGVEKLFAPDAQIFENGGVEGNFDHYRDHHLGPELKAFKAFPSRTIRHRCVGKAMLRSSPKPTHTPSSSPMTKRLSAQVWRPPC